MWIPYALAGAFFQAAGMAIEKKALRTRGVNNFIACAAFLIAGAVLGITIVAQRGVLRVTIAEPSQFWLGVGGVVLLNVIAVYYLYRALGIAELNYLMPFMALTSLAMIVPPMFVFGEMPSARGALGILLIVAGAVVMDYRGRSLPTDGPGRQSRGVANRRGLRYFLITAACFTVAPTAMKAAIAASDVLSASFVTHASIGLAFIPLVFAFREWTAIRTAFRASVSGRRVFPIALIAAGLAMTVENTSINVALASADVAYVMAIKRSMPLFAFCFGYWFFGERDAVRYKVVAALLMVAGAVLMTLFP